jgi:hypothetical protein
MISSSKERIIMKTKRSILFYEAVPRTTAVLRTTAVFVLMTVMAMNAAAAESDFEFNGNGTITKYAGWDTDVVIPATIGGKPVVTIGSSAFNGAGLTSVTIPEGVVDIGRRAFADNKLTKVTIPGTVRTIRGAAFANNLLTEAVIPEGVTTIEISASFGDSIPGPFSGNKLTKLTIPSTVKTIQANAFANLALTELVIPEGVVEIGGNAFANNKLTVVVIPEGVKVIGGNAFGGNKLDSITLPESLVSLGYHNGGMWVTIGGDPETFILGKNICGGSSELRASLGASVFYNYIANDRKAGTYTKNMPCEGKTSGDFAYNATQYGAILTKWTGGGNRLRIPAELDGVAVKGLGGTLDIFGRFDGLFKARGLENILIPEGITYIGESAFGNLGGYRNNLTQLTLPESVTYIGGEAFCGNKLTSLTIPDGVQYIGPEAFSENNLTQQITLPNSVTYVGARAFGNNRFTYRRPEFSATHSTSENLRIRADQTLSAATIKVLEKGTRVQVQRWGNNLTIDGNTAKWAYVITVDGLAGWCYSGYLKELQK